MKSETRVQILVSVAALSLSGLSGYAASQTASNLLASPESFVAIADTETRSAAIFSELGKVLTSPRCLICHQNTNFEPGRVPGHPEWHLAPREMAWEGKTLAEICAQIKDPARNGGRKVEDLIHHIADNSWVGWAWASASGRHPAPGTQKQAGAIVEAWVKTGAAC